MCSWKMLAGEEDKLEGIDYLCQQLINTPMLSNKKDRAWLLSRHPLRNESIKVHQLFLHKGCR